jgi:hypothetical protein
MNTGIKVAILTATLLPLFAACGSDKQTVKRQTTTTTTYTAPEAPPPIVEKRTTITEIPN